ncbi:prepilin peptidase [Acidisoma sp. 7E03]
MPVAPPPALVLLLFGAITGSLVGVLIRRLPVGRRVMIARSSCDHCGYILRPRDLVPLLSFLALRGRCRSCGSGIGWFHPTVELAAIAIAGSALLADGPGWTAWIDAALGWALLCAAWIDAETFRLPDVITLPLVLAGLAVTLHEQPDAVTAHALAAALGYGAFRLLDALYHALRSHHGLGQGDAKLLAAAGAWLGLTALPDVVLLAGILGLAQASLLIVLRRQAASAAFAFGPTLALAFFVVRLLQN